MAFCPEGGYWVFTHWRFSQMMDIMVDLEHWVFTQERFSQGWTLWRLLDITGDIRMLGQSSDYSDRGSDEICPCNLRIVRDVVCNLIWMLWSVLGITYCRHVRRMYIRPHPPQSSSPPLLHSSLPTHEQ